MPEDNEFITYLLEQLEPLGSVQSKRMFGGHGIFMDGLMFGLVADEVLYLKADEKNESDFTKQDLEPFTYHKKGKPFKLSYFEAPEDIYESEDTMHDWAKKAYGAALRSAKKKKAKEAQAESA